MTGALFPFWLVISGCSFLLVSYVDSEGRTTGIKVRNTDHDGKHGADFLSSSECQQGQTLAARRYQEHVANAERAATASAEGLCWRRTSPSWVPQAVLTSRSTHLRANVGK